VAANRGALVVTVAAGRPGPHELTDWDRRCGFGPDDDVMGARRLEDESALQHLGATPRWLDFLDRQYADWSSPDPIEVAEAIRELVRDAGLVASPLGLTHPDHVAVAAACFDVARTHSSVRWIVYEDAIYRAKDGESEAAVAGLRNDGLVLNPIEFPPASLKRVAIESYTTQLRGLGDLVQDAYLPERYWELGVR